VQNQNFSAYDVAGFLGVSHRAVDRWSRVRLLCAESSSREKNEGERNPVGSHSFSERERSSNYPHADHEHDVATPCYAHRNVKPVLIPGLRARMFGCVPRAGKR
jgi:hypothetical protein